MANQFPRNGLTKQQVSLKLTGGIDRKTDPKQLQNGQMYTADNVQYITEGQIRKRYGYNNLTPPGGLQGAPFAAVGCRDNVEPLILGTGALNRYNPTTGLSTYIPANTQGRMQAAQITASSGLPSTPCPPVNGMCATDGQKYTFVTWEEFDSGTGYGYIFYGIQDLTTGSWILSPTQCVIPSNASFTYSGKTYAVTTQYGPRAYYSNGYFYLALTYAGSNTTTSGGTSTTTYAAQVQAYAINLTNLAAGLVGTNLNYNLNSQSTAIVASGPVAGWDMTISNGVYYIALVAYGSAGTGTIATGTVSALNFAQTASGTYTGAVPSNTTYQRVSIATGTNASYPVAVTTGTSLLTFRANLTQLTRTDFSTPTSDAYCYPTATIFNGNVAYGIAMGSISSGQNTMFVTVLGVNVATSTLVFSANYPAPSQSVATGIVSRPWIYNGRMYIWVFGSAYGGWGVFREQILMEINLNGGALNYVARTSYQNAGLTNQPYQLVASDTIQIPGTNKYLAYLTQTTDVVGGTPASLGTNANQAASAVVSNSFYGVLTRTQFDFSPATPNSIVNLPTGGNFITGPFPQQYDGQALVEAGYSAAPDFTTAPGLNGNNVVVSTSVSTSKIAAGTYTYYACFCHRDAYGNIIRSSPSSPLIYTLPANAAVTFPSVYYSRIPGTYIEYYRTTLAVPLQPQLLAKVPNGTQFIDIFADSSFVSNPTLYTYSGEYPNDPPPAVHSMAVGETRAYIIPSDSRNTIWCSKKYAPGRTVEWTSNLILTEGGTHSGDFTAIAVLDTNIIVFKQNQILYFYGDGPDNAGATGSFSAFQRLSSDVGCIDPGSIAIIPAGLLFRSQRGIELLSRGLQVSYVGWPVEPIAQSITTIASATVMPQYQQVRFVPSVAGEPTLVYDYLGNRWSTYSNMAALSSANVLGNYWWISSDGSTCNVETPGAFTDAGNFIQLTIETPEIPSSSLQGWGRIYRVGVLGEMKTSHQLTVSFAYDHQEVYTDNIAYNAASSADIAQNLFSDNMGTIALVYVTVPGPEQFRFSRVPRQVMQTLRLRLQDSPLTVYYWNDIVQPLQLPYGESCAISNITLETGQKAILAKLPGSQTV